jgi:hypothetical protein
MPRPSFWVPALGALLCCVPRPALAEDTIVTTGAEIAAGAGSPAGRTILDPLAPPAPQPVFVPRLRPPVLAELVSDIPPLGETGEGVEALVAAAGTTTTLPSGTHDYASFTVEADAGVECLGPVTIRVTGAVSIQGSVTSASDGASITFVCGGGFAMGTGPEGAAPSIETSGSDSHVTIDAATSVSIDAAAGSVIAANGDVTLRHRRQYETLVLRGVEVSSDVGAVSVRSDGSLALTNVSVDAAGDIDLCAFNGVLSIGDAELDASGALRARSRSQVSFTDVAATSAGAIDLLAVHGRVNLTRTTVETVAGSSGDITVRSGDHTFVSRSTLRHRGTGTLAMRAIDLVLEYPQNAKASYVLHEGDGDVRMLLDSMLITYGGSQVVAEHGDVLVHAYFVEANGDARFSAIAGTLDFNTDQSVKLRASFTGGPAGLPDLEAGTISIAARDEDASLSVDRADAGFGGFTLLASRNVSLRGTFASAGPVSIRSVYFGIDLAGADVSTAAASGRATAPIVVETSYSFDRAIDATGARIRSGDATDGASGDVVLAVHARPGGLSSCNGCDILDGATPGHVEAATIDAHSIRLSWIPRDREGTGFVVERRTSDSPFEVVATAGPGDLVFVDEGLAADTGYTYRVSVRTGVVTSAPSETVSARTKTNIGVRVQRAVVVDKPMLGTDLVALSLKLRFFERSKDDVFDPTAAPLRISVGEAFVLSIPANDARWTQEDGVFEWNGPVGSGGQATVRVHPESRRLDVRAKGYGVIMPGADRSYVSVRTETDAGLKSLRKRSRR